MKWFEGTIPEAIQLAKTRKAVFIVYIEGSDDDSKQMTSAWENSSSTFDGTRDCVCLKLEAQSDSCRQFSLIYPVIVVPSTFFIRPDGTLCEIIGGSVTKDELEEKWHTLNQAVQSASESIPSSSQATSDSETTSEPAGASAALPVDDKVTLAQKKLDIIKQNKELKKREEAKQDETKRREVGKNLTDLKRWQKDQEQKEVMSEWKKEKEEARIYREKVKQEIARDREERAKRFNKEKSERQSQVEVEKLAKDKEKQEEMAKAEAIKRETARLQFRMPDGSSITEQFASSETLGAARTLLRAKIQYKNFTLSTLYPRRVFVEADMTATLLDLELAPTAVILVMPSSQMSISQSPEGESGAGFIWLLLAPFIALWNVIYNFLFATPAVAPPAQAEGQGHSQQKSEESSSQPSSLRKRPKSSYGVRREGNVNRFSNDDDDDDMTTWNGNSTQQM